MLMLYFSGTGNSEYIARQFSHKMNVACHSIEEKLDFQDLIKNNKTIAFSYPVYGSCVPRSMREFVAKNQTAFKNKTIIIFCTQMVFSGDGAKALYRLLPSKGVFVVYAEHFKMPNNISNFWLFPIREKERMCKLQIADKKIEIACLNIKQGIVKRRGWGALSHLLGFIQNLSWPRIEKSKCGSFRAGTECNRCGLCVQICPTQNLAMGQDRIDHKNNCMLCYRCVNQCPQKAISVLLSAKPTKQYKGPGRKK